jgi:hypothetical protein
MAGRGALPATVALAVAAGLTLGAAGMLDMLERPERDVPVLRWLAQEGPETGPAAPAEPVPPPGPTRRIPPGPASGPASEAPHTRLRAAPAPVALHIERLDVRAPIAPVGVAPDGGMEIPDDVGVVGWYAARVGRVSPGDAGTAVIAGHRDSRVQGEGALHDLASLRTGDRIDVIHLDGQVSSWQVDGLLTTRRDELPTDLLFARDGEPRLALVTCGGAFDRGTRSYTHNTIVLASMITARETR